MQNNEFIKMLQAKQDDQEQIRLLQRAVAKNSITGNEANFVDLLSNEMNKRKLNPKQSDFLPGRPNIWGERSGSGGGPRLLFVGHTDTVHVEGWNEAWQGTTREDPFAGAIVDGAIWGRGVADLKGGICASLAALDLLDQAGITLKGDIAYAFVGDEESGEPGTGVSAGISHWTDQVLKGNASKPDFAIYVEPTNLSVYTANIGFFIADVTVTGKSAYFGRPDLGVDALKATHKIITSVWHYAAQLESLPAHELTGQSSILITAINSGGSIAVPGECKFSLIGTLRPGDKMNDVVSGLEAAINTTDLKDGINVSIAYTAGRDHKKGGTPVEVPIDNNDVQLLLDSVNNVVPQKARIGGAPYWSESTYLINKLNCPTVYCAPGDISVCHTTHEHINIEEYLAAVRAYALFIAQYCGYTTSVEPTRG